jgi:EAL domain-containing protein (putative c-di-GMP-specific phosphodiesterase class I)
MVPPDVFVPLACDIGMVNELTHFVLTTALRNAGQWPDTGDRLGISVNLEAQTLQEIDLNEIIKSSLSIWGSDDIDLTLEITETALAADSQDDFQRLGKLRSLGVGISVDDFGTGYSSLSYFTNIPATELKIDKSFVKKMCDCAKSHRLVEAIISLAHRFDLTVVAEGVETAEQLESLKKLKCDIIQGFYVSKAMPHDEFCEWLAAF